MAFYVDPDTGERYENDAEDAPAKARRQGLVPEEEYERGQAEKRSGGALDQAATFVEEGVRKVASGAAAVARGVLGDKGHDAGLVNEVTGSDKPFGGADLVPGAYSEQALERRAVNPMAAAAGSAVPLVAGGIAAPFTGGASLAVTLGLDAVDAGAQEAMDAELEGRGISGENILRNGVLNMAFSGAGHALPAVVKAGLGVGENAVKKAARTVVSKAEEYGAKKIAQRTAETVESATEALEKVKPPVVATNPNAQRMALQDISDSFAKSHPDASATIEGLVRGNGKSRFQGLQELRATNPGPEVERAIEDALQRPDLWGQKAIDHAAALNVAKQSVPTAGATPDVLTSYAESLRNLQSAKLTKLADRLDELAQTSALAPIAGQIAEGITKTAAGKAAKYGSTVAGAVVGGGWPGGLLGHGVGALLEGPAERLASMATPAAERYLVKAGEAMKRFAENDQRITAQLMVRPETAERFMRVLGDTPTPLARFQGDDETPQQAFLRHRNQLERFTRDPMAMVDTLDEELGDVGAESPALARQMAEQSFKVGAFLQEKMPKPRGVSVARPQGTPVSPLELRTYALYATAAMDPGSVLQDAKAGRLKREQVETLQRLWPGEYNGLRNAVIEMLGAGSSTVVRQRMNLLFGLGSSIDPALGPKVRAMVAAAREQKSQQAQAPTAPGMSAQQLPSTASDAPAGQTAMQLSGTGGR